jgi:hypothetical protein
MDDAMTTRPRARALSTPPGVTATQHGVIRARSGSIGADVPLLPGQHDAQAEPFFAEPGSDGTVANEDWAESLARREAAAGLPATAGGGEGAPERYGTPAWQRAADAPNIVEVLEAIPRPVPRPPADLSPLPDRFTLQVERKPDGWWIVTAPGVHIGLFVAAPDLPGALADAPATLAQIVRLDGIVARGRRRK